MSAFQFLFQYDRAGVFWIFCLFSVKVQGCSLKTFGPRGSIQGEMQKGEPVAHSFSQEGYELPVNPVTITHIKT